MAQESLRLVSPSISHEGRLPRKYTGEGQGARKDISPPLEWYSVPDGAKSLALVVQDADAPAESDEPAVPWTHWVVVNIPPGIKGLPEGFSGKEEVMGADYAGIKEGNNDHKVPGWRGPRPPDNGHRIQFKLYALDIVMHLGNKLVSPTIDHGGRLPRKYTAEGQGALKHLSPPLEWYNVPEGTKSLALVVQDLDAPEPSGPIVPWTHWVVVNIPTSVNRLPEGFSGKEEEMGKDYAQIQEGYNDYKLPGWRGPKPPTTGHRFQFKLYALDDLVHLGNKVTKEKLMDAIQGHVLGEAELVAIF